MSYDNLPEAMKALPNWLVWRLEPAKDGSKPRKAPYSPKGGHAKTNDPSTWCSYPEAVKAVSGGKYSGIGFVFTGTPFIGVDIDGIIKDGTIDPRAIDTINMAQWPTSR